MAPTPGKFYIFDARGTGEPYDINSPVTPMLGHIIKQVQATHPDVVVEHVQFTAALGVLAGSRDPLAPSGDNAANQIVRWLRERIAQLGPVMAFSFSDPDGFLEELIEGGGIEDVVASLTRWDNWLDPGWRSWPGDLQAYMTHSHTTDYGLKLWRDSSGKAVSGIDLLARQINWRISREKAAA